jgi:hypothetical protein
VGSIDTDACGVLLRMKLSVFQKLKPSFLLSSQPQAGVSKHATRVFCPEAEVPLRWHGEGQGEEVAANIS